MKAWVTADGKATDSVVGQQAFIIHELDTDYSNVKSAVLQDSTPASAAADWNTLYEGSGDTTDNREEAANSMYQAFASLAGTPQTTVASSGCSSSSTSPDCTGSVTGNAEILCTAQQYAGIFYLWGGGHDGYANFKAKCTAQVLSNASKTSTAGDPGPCATDCSGLVSMSVDQAFNQTQDWTVASLQADTSDWTKIPMSSIQPGDVVTVASEHVEIVDFYDASTGTVHTFGSHYTGVTTGPTSSPTSYWTGGAYRYKGPTS
jgi:hypothetical protein